MSAPSPGPRYVVVVDPPVEASFVVDMRPKDGGSPVAYLHISDITKCHEVAAALNAQDPHPQPAASTAELDPVTRRALVSRSVAVWPEAETAPTATGPAVTEKEIELAILLIDQTTAAVCDTDPENPHWEKVCADSRDAMEHMRSLFRRALAGGGK